MVKIHEEGTVRCTLSYAVLAKARILEDQQDGKGRKLRSDAPTSAAVAKILLTVCFGGELDDVNGYADGF